MVRRRRLIMMLLVLDSIAVVLIWTMELAGGAFQHGLFAFQMEGTIPLFHLVAELGMATFTLVGVFGWWQKRAWGRGVTLFGLGMFTYSAVNSMGWAIHNDIALLIPMLVTLLIAIFALPVLVRQEGSSMQDHRTAALTAQPAVEQHLPEA